MLLEFTVHGIPQPAGSKQAFPYVKGWKAGKPILGVRVVDANDRAKPWQAEIAAAAREAMGRANYPAPYSEAVALDLVFAMPRPKSHFRTGRFSHLLRDDAPRFPTSRPDTTKLIRAVEDALTEIVWADDAQVITQSAAKVYGDRPGVAIRIRQTAEADEQLELPLGTGPALPAPY